MQFNRIGIVGLGNMGLAMAINLIKKGVNVSGFDISSAAIDNAKKHHVATCKSLSELIEHADVIISSLPKAEHVQVICLGDGGIINQKKPQLIVIDTTTSTPDVSRQIYDEFVKHDMVFVDAPVSGGPKGAINGTMSMLVGADDDVYQTVLPLLELMSARRVHVGKVGAGNVVKIGNNLLAAAHLITTAEMVSLAYHAGVHPDKFLQGLNQGSGRSAVSEVNFPIWVLNHAYDSGFSMGLMRKDVGLAKQMADDLGLELPIAKNIAKIWQSSRHVLEDERDFNEMVKLTDKIFNGR